MKIDKEYIHKHLLTKTGGLNSNKTKDIHLSNEELYFIYHELTEIPKCPVCKKERKFNNFKKGYFKTCTEKYCINNDPNRNRKIQENMPNDIGKKRKRGLLNRSKEEIEKATKKSKNTKLEKHGDENYVNREKAEKTIEENYGVQDFLNSHAGREKSKATKLERYGDVNYNNIEKINNTREVRKKEGIQYTRFPNTNIEKLNKSFIEENFIKDGYFLIEDFKRFYSCKNNFAYVKLRELGITFKSRKSYQEYEISKLLEGSVTNVRNIISPLEIDIYSEKHNLAIEYNGLLSHSYGYHRWKVFDNLHKEDPYYHLRKTEMCEEKGIRLFHIFENEWLDPIKKDIWISKIKEAQGLNEKVYIDNFKDISLNEASLFLEENDLEDFIEGSSYLGFYSENRLVAVVILKGNKIYRMGTLKFISIDILYILDGIKSCFDISSISISLNRRWENVEKLKSLGFKIKEVKGPEYFYFQFGKDKEISKNTNESLLAKGYRKIYDCGRIEMELSNL